MKGVSEVGSCLIQGCGGSGGRPWRVDDGVADGIESAFARRLPRVGALPTLLDRRKPRRLLAGLAQDKAAEAANIEREGLESPGAA